MCHKPSDKWVSHEIQPTFQKNVVKTLTGEQFDVLEFINTKGGVEGKVNNNI